jgi:hypothetical protein
MKSWKRKVNKRLKVYGEIDYDRKEIVVNPRKGDLVNTCIHEELHRRYPDKPEKWISRRASFEEKQLSVADQINLLKKYL